MFKENRIIGILGGGQLGKMVLDVANKWGLKVYILDSNENCPSNKLCSKFFQGDFKAGAAEASFNDQNLIEEFEIDNKLNLTKDKISYNTLATSIDNLISLNLIDFPKLIKIDVDGNEVEILNGCSKLLNKGQSLSILIETRPSTEKIVEQKLTSHGFKKIKSLKYNSVWEN